MKNSTKYLLCAVAVLLIFFVVQVVSSCAVLIFSNIHFLQTEGRMSIQDVELSPSALGYALFYANLFTILLLWILRLCRRHPLRPLLPMKPQLYAVAAVGFLFVSLGVSALLSPLELDDLGMLQQFESLKSSVPAVITLCLIGPICEELVFREGILRYLMKAGLGSVQAVVLSALVFGGVHLDPAQMVPAILLGLVLGLFYVKTGNILLSAIAHILNNTLCVLMIFFPVMDPENWGLSLPLILTVGALVLASGIYMVVLWKNHFQSETN